VLAVLVLFFALWTVALKHTLTGSGGGAGSGNSPSAPALQSAINQAKGLQGVVNSAGGRAGGTPSQSAPPSSTQSAPPSTTPKAITSPNSTTTPNGQSTPATRSHATQAGKNHGATAPSLTLPVSKPTGVALVKRALQDHKVLALLFYNPAAADDRAVHSELRSIPVRGGKVVKMTVPLQNLGNYSGLLNEIPVNFSPTLVLIDRNRQADAIAGFADSYEIAQRVDAALGSRPAKS
jgi:hypothetical protein